MQRRERMPLVQTICLTSLPGMSPNSWSTILTIIKHLVVFIRVLSIPMVHGLRPNPWSFMNMLLLTYIREISPRPVLIIAGEKAHSRYFSEDAYKAAVEPKELVIIPGAVHLDLSDKTDVIPFDKLETFFKEKLKVESPVKASTEPTNGK
jgi:hypothetical protein